MPRPPCSILKTQLVVVSVAEIHLASSLSVYLSQILVWLIEQMQIFIYFIFFKKELPAFMVLRFPSSVLNGNITKSPIRANPVWASKKDRKPAYHSSPFSSTVVFIMETTRLFFLWLLAAEALVPPSFF